MTRGKWSYNSTHKTVCCTWLCLKICFFLRKRTTHRRDISFRDRYMSSRQKCLEHNRFCWMGHDHAKLKVADMEIGAENCSSNLNKRCSEGFQSIDTSTIHFRIPHHSSSHANQHHAVLVNKRNTPWTVREGKRVFVCVVERFYTDKEGYFIWSFFEKNVGSFRTGA